MIYAFGRTFNITQEMKERIDSFDRITCAKKLRFEVIGSDLFCGDNYDYLLSHFQSLGGMTPALSKLIGWGNDLYV